MLQFIKSKLCRTSSEPLPQVANLQGIGTRARQEDSFAFVNALDQNQYDAHGMMFCVCDGMGGMLDGKLASETAVQSLRESFAELDYAKPVGAQLTQNLRDASGKIAALLGGISLEGLVWGIALGPVIPTALMWIFPIKRKKAASIDLRRTTVVFSDESSDHSSVAIR